MSFRLGLNLGFATNRYPEPKHWAPIVQESGVHQVQFVSDLCDPRLPRQVVKDYIHHMRKETSSYGLRIQSCFTGQFSRVNHLSHPNESVREYWTEYFKKLVDFAVEVDAESIGSHFGIMSIADDSDPSKRIVVEDRTIEAWRSIADYAASRGLSYLMFEPMSISREYGETLRSCRKLLDKVNEKIAIPMKLCLDVDHGDITSPDPRDFDAYSWISQFAREAPVVHLKQSLKDKSAHRPFTEEFNRVGQIQPRRILDSLTDAGRTDADLFLEISFRERNPVDQSALETLQESVKFWISDDRIDVT